MFARRLAGFSARPQARANPSWDPQMISIIKTRWTYVVRWLAFTGAIVAIILLAHWA
jgi:hypothetical protein